MNASLNYTQSLKRREEEIQRVNTLAKCWSSVSTRQRQAKTYRYSYRMPSLLEAVSLIVGSFTIIQTSIWNWGTSLSDETLTALSKQSEMVPSTGRIREEHRTSHLITIETVPGDLSLSFINHFSRIRLLGILWPSLAILKRLSMNFLSNYFSELT